MERVCEELDEAKAEIEKLKVEYRNKAESSENFKKAYNEQLTKLKELSSKFNQQTQELNEKSEEASTAKQKYEELKCCLNEKESIIKHLKAANDKLRVDCDEKFWKWEEENRKQVLALDEANEKNMDQEQKIHFFKEEIEGLKRLLSVSKKKCLEAEKNAKASEELRQRDDMLVKSEEQYRRVEDQLKWKKEQFNHLEEAHEKLRNQFWTSKKEWEQEISTLLDKICALQSKLDSQTRISEGLQRQLQMCNQALAQEERQRKYLEIQLSESKTCFENVFSECQDAKSKIEHLSIQRDKEIAALRNSLSTKETIYKEADFRARKLEQENQDLLISLKELQEERIHGAGASSSLAKLRNKLKSLEHMHRDCSENLRAKEAQWSSQQEKLTSDLNDYMLKIESKDADIKELGLELEGCHSSIMQLKSQNEELKLRATKLEKDNQELQTSLEELQEQQIHESGVSSLEGLQNKVESLEHMYRDCSSNLRAKEAEWSSQLEKLTGDLSDYRSKVESKDAVIKELSMELEGCYSSLVQLKLQSEEASLMVLVLKLGLSEAQLKLASEKDEMALQNKEREENVSHLMNKLEMKSAALVKAQADIEEEREKVAALLRRVELLELIEQQQVLMQKELERHKEMLEESSKYQLHLKGQALQMESNLKARLEEACDDLDRANSELVKAQADSEKEREKVASLLRRVESLDLVEQQQLLMQKELERLKEMLEESSKYQLHLKEQSLQMESNLKARLREACDALDRANSELSEKICEGSETEFELQIWKSIADHLKAELQENLEMRKSIEASLLAQIEVEETLKQERDALIIALEEKDRMIDDFQRQIRSLDQEMKAREIGTASFARTEAVMAFESEKEIFLQTTKEKDRILEKLQEEIERLEHESLRRELEGSLLARIVTERTFELEKSNLIQLMEEKEERVEDLQKLVRSLEQNFNSSMISFSSQLVQKQAEINLVHEAWEKIATAEILAQLEIEEKKVMIMELEDDIHSIQQKLEFQEKSLSHSKQQALEIEAELEAKQLEVKKLTTEMETNWSNSEGLVNELESKNKNLVEELAKLSSERENLLGFIGDMCDGIDKFSCEDMQLTRSLERIMHTFDTYSPGNELKRRDDDTPFNPNKENFSTHLSPTLKKFEAIPDERSPFREVNN
ncbi:hypothetical protein VitviT2T_010753 [Vitis vinifera]|uniref:Uncharacterized protein n=2 Tax=Vitis vinifera TaxID=29760 RepID=A0ABY9CB53_VITVI|nr:Uncharacterized protein CK203_000565 [Vitis vinifera]WJZ91706.1 hypothetical protein VitviT2T_010753 [Vitis vinifera]